jgi:hypothetical protein
MVGYKLGKLKDTGEIIDVYRSERGSSCNCICPDCGKDFIAAQGEKNEWHFRHKYDTTCSGGQETALHQLAKEILFKNSMISLPDYGVVNYSEAKMEKGFQGIIPDVSAIVENQDIFFEVFVTHKVENEKEKFYKNGQHKSVEVDLSNFQYSTMEALEKEVLQNNENKRIIFWELRETKTDESLRYVLIFLLSIVGGYLIWDYFKSRKRSIC